MNTFMKIVTMTTAVTCAVSGGALFAFSSFVMPAIRSLPTSQAVQAMQAVNVEAPKSGIFMIALVGSAVGSIAIGGYALFASSTEGRGWLLAGAVLGLSVLGITARYHIPRNDALALVDPNGPATPQTWLTYAAGWTSMNHVRAATGIAGAIALVIGLRST